MLLHLAHAHIEHAIRTFYLHYHYSCYFLIVFSSFYYLIAICIIKRMIDIFFLSVQPKQRKKNIRNEYLATVIIAETTAQALND